MKLKLLTARELSEMLSVPLSTIYSWRYQGSGPTGLKVGRHLRFRPEDVETWLKEQAA